MLGGTNILFLVLSGPTLLCKVHLREERKPLVTVDKLKDQNAQLEALQISYSLSLIITA